MKKTIYSEDYELFRTMIREERLKLGWSQVEMAEKIGSYQPFVTRLESGQRRLDVVEFLHLMKAMGVNPTRFLANFQKRLTTEI